MDNTQPIPIDPEENEDPSELETTRPVATTSEQPETSDPGQTIPLATGVEEAPRSGFEDTIPPTSETGGDIPTSSESSPPAGAAEMAEATEPPPLPAEQPKSKFPLWLFVLVGVLFVVMIAAFSTYAGYQNGINQRKQAESTQVAYAAQEQYDLAVQDMQAKRYDLARQRFEYVIQINPNYPGVTEKLADVLLELNTTATPTPKPTPTITPTPDLRGVEELFVQAQQDLSNNDWNSAINTLLALRKADPNYQPVWVDDMLYVAYRNLGKDKILKEGDLEGGIYDLTQAEQIGLLDAETKGYLTWSRLYITGASFWELDWGQAVYYFAQIQPALPNLRDGSGWTATERYRLALVGYGLFLEESGDWCNAKVQYELSLTLGTDPQVQESLDIVAERCDGGGSSDSSSESSAPPPAEPTPTSEIIPTEPPPSQPTETPAPQVTATEAPPPTEEPPTEPPPTDPPPTEAPPTEEPTSTPES